MIFKSEELRILQAKEFEMLKEFVRVCDVLKIRYYLIGGTLLGAVRHSGFIPWDDDIDIGVPREDYQKLMYEGSKYFRSPFFLQSFLSDPNTPFCFMKLRDSNTTFIQKEIASLHMNHGVWIDIFPLDECEKDILSKRVFRIKQAVIDQMIGYYIGQQTVSSINVKTLVKGILIDILKRKFPTMQSIVKFKDKLHMHTTKGRFWINFSGTYGEREVMPASWYGDGKYLDFNGLKACVPCEYDKVLSQLYGDYMKLPPEDKRLSHHDVVAFDMSTPYDMI